MEGRAFDRLTKIVGQSASRRASVGAALATLLTFGGGEALAKQQGKAVSKTRRSHIHAEACIPTGKPCPSKKPRGHNKHGKARTLSCNRCCQGHTAVVNGVSTCACQPDTQPCTSTTECCAGVCRDGSCVATTSPPPPPPPPCTGLALGQPCTTGGTPCCTDVNPNAQCGGRNPTTRTCQDCTSPPTTAGAMCQTPPGNQCCGGNANCFVGVKVGDGQPVCVSTGTCNGVAVGACTQDSDCPRMGQAAGNTICIRSDGAAGVCCGGSPPPTTICAVPCGGAG